MKERNDSFREKMRFAIRFVDSFGGALYRGFIIAPIGREKLAAEISHIPISLVALLSTDGNPKIKNLNAIFNAKWEALGLKIKGF